jgi:hypothetical protein
MVHGGVLAYYNVVALVLSAGCGLAGVGVLDALRAAEFDDAALATLPAAELSRLVVKIEASVPIRCDTAATRHGLLLVRARLAHAA